MSASKVSRIRKSFPVVGSVEVPRKSLLSTLAELGREDKLLSRDKSVCTFVRNVVADLESRDLSLLYLTSFEAFRILNEQYQDSWYPLNSHFDPLLSAVSPSNSFWLCIADADGVPVGVVASRLTVISQPSDFEQELTSLRYFYADPERMKRPDETYSMPAFQSPMTGRISYTGMGWVNPSFRSLGLAGTLARLGNSVSNLLWRPDQFISFVSPEMIGAGFQQKYGYAHAHFGVEWRNSFRGTLSSWYLVHMNAQEMKEDLETNTPEIPENEVQYSDQYPDQYWVA